MYMYFFSTLLYTTINPFHSYFNYFSLPFFYWLRVSLSSVTLIFLFSCVFFYCFFFYFSFSHILCTNPPLIHEYFAVYRQKYILQYTKCSINIRRDLEKHKRFVSVDRWCQLNRDKYLKY